MPVRIDPHLIRFSQSSIRYRFGNGTTIDDLAQGLKNGQIKVDDVPPLCLVERGGLLFSLDNRRLEAFRRAGMEAPCRMATPEEMQAESWKFTTTNNGLSIKIRGQPQ
jgi:hypothetical protein